MVQPCSFFGRGWTQTAVQRWTHIPFTEPVAFTAVGWVNLDPNPQGRRHGPSVVRARDASAPGRRLTRSSSAPPRQAASAPVVPSCVPGMPVLPSIPPALMPHTRPPGGRGSLAVATDYRRSADRKVGRFVLNPADAAARPACRSWPSCPNQAHRAGLQLSFPAQRRPGRAAHTRVSSLPHPSLPDRGRTGMHSWFLATLRVRGQRAVCVCASHSCLRVQPLCAGVVVGARFASERLAVLRPCSGVRAASTVRTAVRLSVVVGAGVNSASRGSSASRGRVVAALCSRPVLDWRPLFAHYSPVRNSRSFTCFLAVFPLVATRLVRLAGRWDFGSRSWDMSPGLDPLPLPKGDPLRRTPSVRGLEFWVQLQRDPNLGSGHDSTRLDFRTRPLSTHALLHGPRRL